MTLHNQPSKNIMDIPTDSNFTLSTRVRSNGIHSKREAFSNPILGRALQSHRNLAMEELPNPAQAYHLP